MKFPKFKSNVIKIDTLLGKRSIIEGNVTGKGNFKIDGIITGDISVNGDIVLGEKSMVTGNVSGKNIIIAGSVIGDVEASGQLTIKHTGKINGDQKCGSLIVEEGSSVTGKCEIRGNDVVINEDEEDEAENFEAPLEDEQIDFGIESDPAEETEE